MRGAGDDERSGAMMLSLWDVVVLLEDRVHLFQAGWY